MLDPKNEQHLFYSNDINNTKFARKKWFYWYLDALLNKIM